MANTPQSKKRARQSEKRFAVNKARRSRIRTFLRKVEEAHRRRQSPTPRKTRCAPPSPSLPAASPRVCCTRTPWPARCRACPRASRRWLSAWIAPISFDRMDGRTARFHVPTNFFGSWVSQNYGDVIRRHLASAGIGADRVEFHVAPADASDSGDEEEPGKSAELEAAVAAAPLLTQSAAANPVAGAVADVRAPVRNDAPKAPSAPVSAKAPNGKGEVATGSNLNPQFTFDNFVVGKPNELAHAAARRVAEGPRRDLQPAIPLWRRGAGQDAPDARHRVGASGEFPRGRHPLSLGRAVHVPLRARAARTDTMASSRCSARSTC
jgi:hypothetical protein